MRHPGGEHRKSASQRAEESAERYWRYRAALESLRFAVWLVCEIAKTVAQHGTTGPRA